GITESEECVEEQPMRRLEETQFRNLGIPQEDIDLPGWSKMSLSRPTLQALNACGFTSPTVIQSLAIPPIMQGHDLIGKASTGSGKTLAFGIPILEHVLSLPHSKSQSSSALVI